MGRGSSFKQIQFISETLCLIDYISRGWARLPAPKAKMKLTLQGPPSPLPSPLPLVREFICLPAIASPFLQEEPEKGLFAHWSLAVSLSANEDTQYHKSASEHVPGMGVESRLNQELACGADLPCEYAHRCHAYDLALTSRQRTSASFSPVPASHSSSGATFSTHCSMLCEHQALYI